ncbi:MAG: DUF983 domain-containing protein [Cyclobacteriaceae bacterium]
MFPENTLYSLKKSGKMNKTCSCCSQTFEPEPGYYYGAMFVSYGFNTAYFLGVWILLSLLFENVQVLDVIIALIVLVIALLPLTFRWSRALWISIFVRYKGDCHDIASR